MFTWIPAYEQIAHRLLQYENKQPELVEILESVGVTTFNDQDATGKTFKPNEIDPLTFICYLNKYGDEKRLQFLKALCQKWNIAPLPTDVNGLPNVNAQKVWLFGYKKDRNANEIRRFWNYSKALLNSTITNAMFEDALKIFNVGKQKLTEVMFMVKPNNYLYLNGVVKPYLQQNNLLTDFSNYDEYLQKIQSAKQQLNKSFPQISYEAWMQSIGKPTPNSITFVQEEQPTYVTEKINTLCLKHTSIPFFTVPPAPVKLITP